MFEMVKHLTEIRFETNFQWGLDSRFKGNGRKRINRRSPPAARARFFGRRVVNLGYMMTRGSTETDIPAIGVE